MLNLLYQFLSLLCILVFIQCLSDTTISSQIIKIHFTSDGFLYVINSQENELLWTISTAFNYNTIQNFKSPMHFWTSPNGTIYFFKPNMPSQILPLTIQEIAEMPPMSFNYFPDMIFSGRKQIKIFTIDSSSGHIINIEEDITSEDTNTIHGEVLLSGIIKIARIEYTLEVNLNGHITENIKLHEFSPIIIPENYEFIEPYKNYTKQHISLYSKNPSLKLEDISEQIKIKDATYNVLGILLLLLVASLIIIAYLWAENRVYKEKEAIRSRTTSATYEKPGVEVKSPFTSPIFEDIEDNFLLEKALFSTQIFRRVHKRNISDPKFLKKELECKIEKDADECLEFDTCLSSTKPIINENNTQCNEENESLIQISKYLEINKFSKKFEEQYSLGKGGFAEVFKARYIIDRNFYAIKRIETQFEIHENLMHHKVFSEIIAMTKLSHPNIVRYMTCWIEKGEQKPNNYNEENSISDIKSSELGIKWERSCEKSSQISIENEPNKQWISLVFYIQMEYCTGKTLQDYINERNHKIDRKQNLRYFQQIISALKEIHSTGLIHRDIKPANVFIDKAGNLKVGDFGLAIPQTTSDDNGEDIDSSSSINENAGTFMYLSPEQIEKSIFDEKVDIYSTGLILLELCFSFGTLHERINTFGLLKNEGILPEKLINTYEGKLILKMTERKPSNRPSAVEVCKLECYNLWEQSINSIQQQNLK